MKTYYHDPTGYPAVILADWADLAQPLGLPTPLWYVASVQTHRRGEGNGRAAMARLLEDADREGTTLVLSSAPDEAWTRGWYERLGFTPMHTDDDALVRHPKRMATAPCPRCGGRGWFHNPRGYRGVKPEVQNPDGTWQCDFCGGAGVVGNAECWTGGGR